MRKFITDLDLFGVPVMLTYRGKTSFNTMCGGVVSVLLMLFLVGLFVYELYMEYKYPSFYIMPMTMDYED